MLRSQYQGCDNKAVYTSMINQLGPEGMESISGNEQNAIQSGTALTLITWGRYL